MDSELVPGLAMFKAEAESTVAEIGRGEGVGVATPLWHVAACCKASPRDMTSGWEVVPEGDPCGCDGASPAEGELSGERPDSQACTASHMRRMASDRFCGSG